MNSTPVVYHEALIILMVMWSGAYVLGDGSARYHKRHCHESHHFGKSPTLSWIQTRLRRSSSIMGEGFLTQNSIRTPTIIETDGGITMATFEMPMTNGSLLLVFHPSDSEIFDWHPKCTFDINPQYASRILNTSCDRIKRTLSFTMTGITEKDQGRYICRVGSRKGKEIPDCSQDLRIKQNQWPSPHIYEDHSPMFGKSYSLTCVHLSDNPDGAEALKRQWFKGSEEIQKQTRKVLHFRKLRKHDGGNYSCRVIGGSPETFSPRSMLFVVAVRVPPIVHIEPVTPDDAIKGIAGNQLTLTCNVTEASPPVPKDGYSWSHRHFSSDKLRHLAVRESKLTLDHLTKGDSGQYSCEARNDQNFKETIPPGHAAVTINVIYFDSMKTTPKVEASEGDRVVLDCNVDSNPAAHLSWIVDGQEVRHVTGNVDHYVLERVTCSDSKTYTCRASNGDLPGLERNTSTRLIVNCKQKGEHGEQSAVERKGDNSDPANQSFQYVQLALQGGLLVSVLILVGFKIYKRIRSSRSEGHAQSPSIELEPFLTFRGTCSEPQH